jgi:nitrite reductase/ring-hydroxylating ferredoxin subunit
MKKIKLISFAEIEDRKPLHAQVNGLDLVAVNYDENVSVLYGRCLHRGALMVDGHLEGDNLICGVHGWDYCIDTGVSEYNNAEVLNKFTAVIEDGTIWIDENEVNAFLKEHPQPINRDQYLGQFADTHPEPTEPFTGVIQELAKNGLKNYGHHGPSESICVDRNTLPKWEDIQFLPAPLASRPLLDEEPVAPKVIIGPMAKKPLHLYVTLFITVGLRVAEDFAKAIKMGADAIAVSNSALQAIGCLDMRAFSSNKCPAGIATQKESLILRIIIDQSPKQLGNFFTASADLIKVVARSCGHNDVQKFNWNDLSTLDYKMHQFTGIPLAGISQ